MSTQHYDVIVVGAGFAGLYMIYRLGQQSMSVHVLESADAVDGTWYWNRYPGARCDVESLEYSFSFDEALQQECIWSERYAAQPEILKYIQHVAERFDLRRDIIFAQLREEARHCPSGVARSLNPKIGALEMSEVQRVAVYEDRWNFGGISFARAFNDTVIKKEANELMRAYLDSRMLAGAKDPEVQARLVPTYAVGTKRLCDDTGYFDTYNRNNVTLVDIKKAPIVAVTEDGVRTVGAYYPLDAIICATGFDAITGYLLAVNMRIKDGTDLSTLWANGPSAYLGLMVAGLPNLFTITGPGSPCVLSNVVVSAEQHVEWICDGLTHMRETEVDLVEAQKPAQDEWVQHADDVACRSLMPDTNAWYMIGNIPGKPRMFMPCKGGVGVYRRKCDGSASAEHTGFSLSRHATAQAA